ncbi:MAG: phosphoglucosamine mutase [Ignavibacteria bacterium]|nr:phosphoglucosamine mutase [Ignavibacteria bacterium]
MSLMVSISGIRGVVGASFTPEVVVKYASAFGEYCGRGAIVIGRDGRITGRTVGNIVASTLLQMGCDVIALGICPTPTVQLAVEKKKTTGGISITASHNPIEWNGLKFLAPTGLFLDADENRQFWALAESRPRPYAPWNEQGRHMPDPEFIDEHVRGVLSLPYVNAQLVRARRPKVVVDCVNASGSVIVPRLLREFGCEVVETNCDSSGVFPHMPEPVPENLSDLCQVVRQERADLGIAVDPDVDRLVLIDQNGKPLGEEYTVASVIRFVLEKESSRRSNSSPQPPDPLKVVVNLSTTRAVDDIAGHYAAEVVRTAVGEINVAKKMKEIGAIVGGEGNGGVILPACHIGRDALVGIGLTLQHLAEFGGTMSELKNTLPQYMITKAKVELGTLNADVVLSRIADRFSSAGELTTIDGLKIDLPDSWVHLRKSNTEPIIRIIAEAATKQKADLLAGQFTEEVLRS